MAKTKILRNKKGQEICGAKKHTKGGAICRQTRLGANGRCAHHGGGNPPAGPAHPLWKNGRGSRIHKKLPKHLRETFEETLNDPNVLSLESEMGLLDARLMDLIDKLGSKESREMVEDLMTGVAELSSLIHDDEDEVDIDAMEVIIERLQVILTQSLRDASIWSQVIETVEARRKVSDTERKLIEAQQHAIDAVQLRGLITFFLASLKEHVLPLGDEGKEAIKGVAKDIQKVMMSGSDQAHIHLAGGKGVEA